MREPTSPRLDRVTDVMVALMPWIGMAVGAGLVGVSIWGFRFCRSVVLSVAVASASDANQLAQVLSWLVFFAPIAVLGVFVLAASLKTIWTSAAGRRTPARAGAIILPPQTGYVDQPLEHAVAPQRSLDEETVRRLNKLGERTAMIVNVGAGLFLIISGLSGFTAAWIFTHQPIHGQMYSFGIPIRFLLLCGFLVFAGSAILRDVFKKADTAWLIPLKIFTLTVSRRAEAEAMARDTENRTRVD